MNDMLELAETLGKLIKADPRARRMAKARSDFEKNPSARQLLYDYEQAHVKIQDLEAARAPVEPEDKRRLAELHAQVAGSEVIKELLKAQVEYADLMNTVSARIEQAASDDTES